jgi:hypothetical protein
MSSSAQGFTPDGYPPACLGDYMANGSFHGDLLSDHKTTIVSLTHKEDEKREEPCGLVLPLSSLLFFRFLSFLSANKVSVAAEGRAAEPGEAISIPPARVMACPQTRIGGVPPTDDQQETLPAQINADRRRHPPLPDKQFRERPGKTYLSPLVPPGIGCQLLRYSLCLSPRRANSLV